MPGPPCRLVSDLVASRAMTSATTTDQTGLPPLLEQIAETAHIPVPILEEILEALGPRALEEPQPALALSRYVLEQQPRLKACTEQVWRAVDLWLAAADRR